MLPDEEDFDDEDFDDGPAPAAAVGGDRLKCRRCGSAFEGRSFLIRVEADPPAPDVVELRVCEPCMESLARWTDRRPSNPGRAAPRKSRGRRTPYTEELDRHAVRLHQRPWLILAGSCVAVIAVIAMLAVFTSQLGRR